MTVDVSNIIILYIILRTLYTDCPEYTGRHSCSQNILLLYCCCWTCIFDAPSPALMEFRLLRAVSNTLRLQYNNIILCIIIQYTIILWYRDIMCRDRRQGTLNNNINVVRTIRIYRDNSAIYGRRFRQNIWVLTVDACYIYCSSRKSFRNPLTEFQ